MPGSRESFYNATFMEMLAKTTGSAATCIGPGRIQLDGKVKASHEGQTVAPRIHPANEAGAPDWLCNSTDGASVSMAATA